MSIILNIYSVQKYIFFNIIKIVEFWLKKSLNAIVFEIPHYVGMTAVLNVWVSELPITILFSYLHLLNQMLCACQLVNNKQHITDI